MEKPVHIRRCHLCSTVTEKEGGDRVDRCQSCGKSLAPFYYFDDRVTATQSDKNLRPPLVNEEYFPIQGLTVYWESF